MSIVLNGGPYHLELCGIGEIHFSTRFCFKLEKLARQTATRCHVSCGPVLATRMDNDALIKTLEQSLPLLASPSSRPGMESNQFRFVLTKL
ncbi:hypothetical protein [Loigolactobacillus binensis]|uniref:Uncharacterized protein n=1 Tax=Loigolactobacillus binensis TaxID=2559922 RepID=A0ABW3EDH8_9LACO